jgi:drug/metabolite transporter (DMT)-like permease
MVNLLGAIIANAVFAQSYKFAVARGYDVDWVCMLSFVSSGAILLVAPHSTAALPGWQTIALGIVFGLSGGVAQITFFRSIRYGPLSVSYTIVALSVLIPTLASIILWAERPTLLQALALGGALLAVVLMGDVRMYRLDKPALWAAWLGLAFLASGAGSLCMKALVSTEPQGADRLFLLVGYGVSVLIGVPLVRGRWPGLIEAAVGGVRGLAILGANWLLLRAASQLPGYMVFAAYGAGLVMVNVLAAIVLWRERPGSRALSGVLLAVLAVILFNL